MNYVPNKNRKDFKVKQASFNSDYVKKVLRRLHYFKMTLPLLKVLQKSLLISLALFHTQ